MKVDTEEIKQELNKLRKMGFYVRRDYVSTTRGFIVQTTVNHPTNKVRVKLTEGEAEQYLDKYIALEISEEVNFYEWLMYTIHKTGRKR